MMKKKETIKESTVKVYYRCKIKLNVINKFLNKKTYAETTLKTTNYVDSRS